MKCLKYQYMSPLTGEVYCEAFENPNDAVELDTKTMLNLFNRTSELEEFLDKNTEDLAEYVHEELKDVVLKATFGRHCASQGKLYLLTEIYVRRELNEMELEVLRAWITGQLSDGWGENMDNTCFLEEDVEYGYAEFNDYEARVEECSTTATAEYYVKFWSPGDDWCLLLFDKEETELDIEEEEHYNVFEPVGSFVMPNGSFGNKLIHIYAGDEKHTTALLEVVDKQFGICTADQLEQVARTEGRGNKYYHAFYATAFAHAIYPLSAYYNKESGKLHIVDVTTGEIFEIWVFEDDDQNEVCVNQIYSHIISNH